MQPVCARIAISSSMEVQCDVPASIHGGTLMAALLAHKTGACAICILSRGQPLSEQTGLHMHNNGRCFMLVYAALPCRALQCCESDIVNVY